MAAEDAVVIAPMLSFLLFRSWVSSDLAYLDVDAHPTALADASNGAELLTLAAALRRRRAPAQRQQPGLRHSTVAPVGCLRVVGLLESC